MTFNRCHPQSSSKGHLNAPGFMGNAMLRKAYLGADWIGPPRGQINRLVEVKATKERVAIGISTIDQETAFLTGGDWEANHRQSAKEQKTQVKGGIIPSVQDPDQAEEDEVAAQASGANCRSD
jgi:capsid protein